ncbi:MAG: hypothetical protein GY823_08350 [Flavobacteriaceae bacterium]|nr:hypothetical protein [Flavobacteriaceae bacterium]
MKTKLTTNKTIVNLIIVALFLGASSVITAQEKKSIDLKDFKIIVEKTDNGLKMKSLEGSAWIDLSFNLQNDQQQAIDEYGMTELNEVSSNKDSNPADFLFIITKTNSGIKLKGIEGTAWVELSFTLTKNKKQVFNQYGVTIIN